MIMKALKELNFKKLSISFLNNAGLEGFLKRNNFQREKIVQYEM